MVDIKGIKVDIKGMKVDIKGMKVDIKEIKIDKKGSRLVFTLVQNSFYLHSNTSFSHNAQCSCSVYKHI